MGHSEWSNNEVNLRFTASCPVVFYFSYCIKKKFGGWFKITEINNNHIFLY